MPKRKREGVLPAELRDLRAEDLPLFTVKLHLLFLQEYFSNVPDSSWPGRWVDDVEKTGIVITDQAPIGEEVVQARPVIVSTRGNLGFANMGFDNLREQNNITGRRIHTDLLSGTITLQCISRQGLAAQRLAWQVARAMRAHRRVLTRWGLHNGGQNIQVGSESPAGSVVAGDSDSSWVTVPVYHEFQIQDTFSIEPMDIDRLRAVEIDLGVLGPNALRSMADMNVQEKAEEAEKGTPGAVFTQTVLTLQS